MNSNGYVFCCSKPFLKGIFVVLYKDDLIFDYEWVIGIFPLNLILETFCIVGRRGIVLYEHWEIPKFLEENGYELVLAVD